MTPEQFLPHPSFYAAVEAQQREARGWENANAMLTAMRDMTVRMGGEDRTKGA